MALTDYSIDTSGTPEDVRRRQAYAEALMAKGSDGSPIRSPWQGLNRIAQGLIGGYQSGQDSRDSALRQKADRDLLASYPGANPVASQGAVPQALSQSAPAADTSGKIYNNDEPSPLDPPSGEDRRKMMATILGEAGNEPQLGKNAVASVIRTRAVDGGYGGDTPSSVVTSPNQFEPWNTAEGRARMASALANPQQVAAADAAIRSAYGEGGKAPDDPTEGMTHFYSPAGQAALGRSAPAWAGGESVTIGGHVFNSPDDAPGKPVQVASVAGYAPQNAPVPVNGASASPPQQIAQADPQAAQRQSLSAWAQRAIMSTNPQVRQMAVQTLEQLNKPRDSYSQIKDEEGNLYSVNNLTNQRTMLKAAEKDPEAVRKYEYGLTHPDFVRQELERTKAGAAQLNNQNNIDMNSGQTYDKQLAEGLGKSHAALANGVEDAQARARDMAAMQGAIDAIQKNGGTTGGMGQAQVQELKKTINAATAGLGITTPFDEKDISDKEFLTKFNRQIAGAQAKGAVGSRVTNFEMSNYLKANPGLDMSVTGNQRLIGIQSQIEQRNIAVGNQIRNATAQAISQGKKIDPVTVQKLITDYDEAHHIHDPVNGQDLTQSYTLPEFQKSGTNAALSAGHETNLKKIRRYNPATGNLE